MWAVWLLAAPAFVAIWSGWVQLGTLTGFGRVQPLPGLWDGLWLDSRITLPIGMEAYAALALRSWLDHRAPEPARRFARVSAFAALGLGAAGQVAYHLMAAAGVTRAPWPVTALVACLPVAVLGMGAALAHLLHTGPAPMSTTPAHVHRRGPSKPAAGAERARRAQLGTTAPVTRRQPPRRPVEAAAGDTRARVAQLVAARPGLAAGEVSSALGVSARTARRHLADLRAGSTSDYKTTEVPDVDRADQAREVVELDRARERTPA